MLLRRALDPFSAIGQRPLVTDSPESRASEETRRVEAARAGDRPAFDLLYRRYASMVHGILLSRVSHRDVEDLAQDVFLIVFRRLPELRDPAAFPGWLARIARNRATDHLRRTPRTEDLPEDLPSEDPRKLPEAYRETLILRFIEGMTGPEIAARTGLTPGSVRVNLHRGMALLRERLGGRESHG